MPRGGKREGAGRPKGPEDSTLAKRMARQALQDMVIEGLRPMVQRQMAHAMGIGHLFTRDKNGKFTRIENEDVAQKLLSEGTEEEDYWIFMKDPNIQAFTDLMNRALDKPAEQEQILNITGSIDIVTVLKERHAKRLKSSEPPQLSE